MPGMKPDISQRIHQQQIPIIAVEIPFSVMIYLKKGTFLIKVHLKGTFSVLDQSLFSVKVHLKFIKLPIFAVSKPHVAV